MARGLAKRIQEGIQASRSPAYQWFWANYAEIAKVARVRGSWKGILAAAIEAGVKIKHRDPEMHALRSAWRRVEADKAQSAAAPKATRKKSVQKKPPHPRLAAPRPSVRPSPTTPQPDDVDDIRRQLAGSARKIPDPL
jgi:hypothetical protein